MPLPMPRWVISSPSHMTSAVPAVHVRMIRPALNAVKLWMSTVPAGSCVNDWPSRPPLPLFNTNTSAVDCISASATVRYRVHCVIFFCPVWPSFCHSSSFGITTPSNCMMIDDVM